MAWGKVALLLAASKESEQHLDALASVLNYTRQIEETTKHPQFSIPTAGTERLEADSRPSTIEHQPKMIFWQITKITQLKPTDNTPASYLLDTQKAAEYDPNKKGSFIFEPPKPLATLTQLAPLLINSLGRRMAGRSLDYRKTIRTISRGKPIKKLAYYSHAKWPLQLTVIVDKHQEHYPYWHDYDEIIKQLKTQLGKAQVQVISVDERTLHAFASQKYTISSSVLLLTDFNNPLYSHRYWAWQALVQTISQQAKQILTLSTAPQAIDEKSLFKVLTINSLQPSNGFSRHSKKQPFKNRVSDAQIEQALTLISPLALVDNGLLRKLRQYFYWGNAALEGMIWKDKRIVQGVMGIRIQPSEYEHYHKQFSALEPQIKKQFWKIVNQHQTNAYQGLTVLNGISEAALTPQSQANKEPIIEQLKTLLAYSYQAQPKASREKINQQLKTLAYFVPKQAWESGEFSTPLHHSIAVAFQEDIKQGKWPDSLPAGCKQQQIPLLNPSSEPTPLQTYQLIMQGLTGQAVLKAETEQQSIDYLQLTASDKRPAVWQYADREEHPLKQGDPLQLAEHQRITLSTAEKKWEIEAITCPDFAQNIGQDHQGLFVETQLNKTGKRYYWLSEQEGPNKPELAGVWVHEAMDLSKIDRDQYGVYKEIMIKNITQRFRYIPPGQFLMGSPESEVDRELWDAKETLHQVTLTNGFWLADTTVTQALYQAVMGENPSHFSGEGNLPVEKVSWEDAQQFISQLNQLIPELTAQLPSEAQWEYACRAGTDTVFSWGENITPEQVNYEGSRPYRDAKKGLNREKTIRVKSLPANPWGLHEMHGNVWEWCRDAYKENLGQKAVVDPEESSSVASVDRVVRGGSWLNSGRRVRSAFRNWRRPDFRSHYLGFRLSLGLELQSSQEQADVQQSHSRRDDVKEADEGLDAGFLSTVKKMFKGKK